MAIELTRDMRMILCLCSIIIASSGCSEFRPALNLSKPTVVGTSLTYSYTSTNAGNFFKTAFNQAADKKAERNRIIYELMGIIDSDFEKFAIRLRSDRAYKDTIISLVSLGLTGGASLSSKTTANILAAIDTGLKGGNDEVNLNAWGNDAPELLINKMNALRSTIQGRIYDNMKKEVTDYPLEAMISDMSDYYQAGSVTKALVDLNASTAKEAQEAKTTAAGKKP
jgi:hypothetical protein